jgi:hypothetical protein
MKVGIKKYISLCVCLCYVVCVYAQLSPKIKSFMIGDKKVEIHVYEVSPSDGKKVFVHVHENEVTSLAVGLQYIQKNGGKVVTLKHSFDNTVNRRIAFNYKDVKYEFDPNRIFSLDKNVLLNSIKTKNKNAPNKPELISQVG